MSNETQPHDNGIEDAKLTGEGEEEVLIERSTGPDIVIDPPNDQEADGIESIPHKTCGDCGLKLQDGNDGEKCLLCQDEQTP